jgi:hypothetical protein
MDCCNAAMHIYQLLREALNPVPSENTPELMAHWQTIALNIESK